jgi:hypothetical protein
MLYSLYIDAETPSFRQERSVKHKRNLGFTKHYYIYMNFCAIHSMLPLVGVTSSIPMVKPWNPLESILSL